MKAYCGLTVVRSLVGLAVLSTCVASASCAKESDTTGPSSSITVNPEECGDLGSLVATCDERDTDQTVVASCMEYLEGVNPELQDSSNFLYRCPAAKVQTGRHCEAAGVIAECVVRISTASGRLAVGRKFYYENPNRPATQGSNLRDLAEVDCVYIQPNNVFCPTPSE